MVAGYKYCKNTQKCVHACDSCPGAVGPQDFYTNLTGCPISSQCDFGVNGLIFVSNNKEPAVSLSPTGTISNTTASSRNQSANHTAIVYNKGSQVLTVPSDKPCVVSLVNYQRQNLTLNFTNNVNVSAYLFTLTYPNLTTLTPVANGKFGVSNSTDMAYLYIGSVNN